MNLDFDLFSFSIFQAEGLADFEKAIVGMFEGEGMMEISHEPFAIEDYFNPEYNPREHVCSCWKTGLFPNYIFFTSNLEDGWESLFECIHKKLKCNSIYCRMSGKMDDYPAYSFFYFDDKMNERYIQSLKDDPRWVFYQQGTPLWFEDTSHYGKKLKKDRMNNEIIIDYLSKLGIDFMKIDENITEQFTCKVIFH